MTAPSQLAQVYATDEHIAIRSGDDYVDLAPVWNVLARGLDGVILTATPWTLTSATVNFGANGVAAQNIISLSGGSPRIVGTGMLFAIDTVTGNTVTLRRPGFAAGLGQPAVASTVTGIDFTILTYDPLIELVSYSINQRYGIDPTIQERSPGWLYNPENDPYIRELRDLTVLEVLYERLNWAVRRNEGDWKYKLDRVKTELEELRDRVDVRWGPKGESAPPSGRFNLSLMR